MGEIVITTNRLALSIATLPEAVGLAVVVLSIGAAGAAVAYAITQYADVDLHFEFKTRDLVRPPTQMPV